MGAVRLFYGIRLINALGEIVVWKGTIYQKRKYVS